MQRVITIEGPKLYRKQYDAIFDPARHSFIEASTKAGKTVGCIVWQFDQCLQHVGHHWWIAPVYGQARIAFERAQQYIPEQLLSRRPNATGQEIYLKNGSVWSFRGADNPDRLYGEDVWSVVVDEASRCKELVWMAVRSTLTATRGKTRVIGNVKGKKNWFYKLCRRAESGQHGYAYHKLTCWDAVEAGVLAEEEILEAKADLPPIVFEELYEAKASSDGSNPFGTDEEIDALVCPPTGKLVVASGIDFARKQDWTVDIGLDVDGKVAEFFRWQKRWRECMGDLARHLERRGEMQGTTEYVGDRILTYHPVATDATGIGDVVTGELQDGILVDRNAPSERIIVCSRVEPFIFTAQRKQILYDNLLNALRTRVINGYPEEVAFEMKNFTYAHTRYGVRYEAADGYHDDCVDSLALSTWAFTRMRGGGWTDEDGDEAWD